MPYLEPVVLSGAGYTLRHIGPQAALYPGGAPVAVAAHAVLNQATMVGRDLPMANQPNSADFVSGSWTGRLEDAGEMMLTFPNKEASDGIAWRNRFDMMGKNQWIEIRNNGYLESVCCIEKADFKRDQVVISGHDGMFQTKGAYERDWITVQAPRDVIERGTQVWVPTTTDNFMQGSLNPQWTVVGSGGSVGIGAGAAGGLVISIPATTAASPGISSAAVTVGATSVWSSTASFNNVTLPTTGVDDLNLQISESSGDFYGLQMAATPGTAVLYNTTGTVTQMQITPATSYSLRLESDGEWVTGYVNGQSFPVGVRRGHTNTTSLATIIQAIAPNFAPTALTATLVGVLTESQQPWLMRSSDKGDYVLPGSATAYPTGGLHGRYFNNADLQTDSNRLLKTHHPLRTQASAGSGAQEYANQQDATINHQANPAGAATNNWSAIWFGAIYLKLSVCDYTFELDFPSTGGANNCTARVWIGKTKWGDQLLDAWTFTFVQGAQFSFSLIPTDIPGTLSYGGGTVARDGWYPIKIEFAVDGGAAAAPQFLFSSISVSYTDPGGTTLPSGINRTVVPATSLSPLGCVDQRHQGISHFDLIQKTQQAFGYQLAIEPASLESGSFPGVLAPRIREGQDFDAVLEPDDHARAEGLLNYSNTLDATDFCASLWGNGAGFQNGNTGQLQGQIYDPHTLTSSLFDVQAWQDYSDAAFASLLQQLLNSFLGLRLAPWQIIAADPIARPRQSYTWPLPGTLAQMRWRPGDGMRVYARDVNIQDNTPRQLLLITRQIHPNGVTATQVSFAARPRSPAAVQKQRDHSITRLQRNYQRQLTTLSGGVVFDVGVSAGATGPSSAVTLGANDRLVRAYLRVRTNSAAQAFHVLINGTDQTTALFATQWNAVPVDIDITSMTTIDPTIGMVWAAVKNVGGVSSAYSYQLFVDVLR